MPQHLKQEKRDAAKTLLLEGEKDHAAIADELRVSIQTIKNYSTNLKKFGDVLPPKVVRQGRPTIVTKEMTEVCYFSLKYSRFCSL